MRLGWAFLICPLLILGSAFSLADEACLAEVKALRAEIADDSRLLAKARGELDRAVALCQARRVERARLILEQVRSQAGLTMGQGQ